MCTTATMCKGTTGEQDRYKFGLTQHLGAQQKVYSMLSRLHLGRNASVLQQHPGPHGWMPCHKFPVSANLCGSEQGLCVQVGEDAEEGRPHFQHLWTDHLVGLGWALVVTTRFAVDGFRSTFTKI